LYKKLKSKKSNLYLLFLSLPFWGRFRWGWNLWLCAKNRRNRLYQHLHIVPTEPQGFVVQFRPVVIVERIRVYMKVVPDERIALAYFKTDFFL
jgi:hypothetical protein